MNETRELGRIYKADPRDRNYRIVALGPLEKTYRSHSWTTGPILDQGPTSECVRYGSIQLLLTRPVQRSHALSLTTPLYPWAQAHDGISYPHDGTTVRAGMQWLRTEAKVIDSFHWAFTMDEVLSWLSTSGPLVLGTDWFTGMDDPTQENGFVLTPDGYYRGGHCFDATRLDVRSTSVVKHRVQITNSWGPSWGDKGKAWLSMDALEYLLFGANGEAVCVMETKP